MSTILPSNNRQAVKMNLKRFALLLTIAINFFTMKINAQATLPSVSSLPFTFTSYTGTTFPSYLTIGRTTVAGISTADLTLDAAYPPPNSGTWRDEGSNGISFRGNATNQAACFQIRVNGSGVSNVVVKWTCHRIVNSGSNDGISLQWRNGSSGAWNNVPDNLYRSNNGLDQSFTVTLPSGANNLSDLRLRWFFYELGSGTDDRIALDDISVGFPASPSVTSAQVCGSGTVTLNATVATGESANWYAAASGGSPLNGSPTTSFNTPTISSTTTYYVAAVNTTTGAESEERTPVLAIVNNSPTFASVAAASPTSLCLGSSLALTVGNGSASTQNLTYSSVMNRMIPDGDVNGTAFTMDVTGLSPTLFSNSIVSLSLDIEHTRDADIEVYLIRPGGALGAGSGANLATRIVGQSVRLLSDVGGTGNNFTGTILQDGAATAITAGSAPFLGTFDPEQAMSSLTGTANGTWTLVVYDDNATQVGQLLDWSITFRNRNSFSTYSWSASPVNPAGFTAATQTVTGVTPDATGNVTYTATGTDAVGCTVASGVSVAVNGNSTAPTGINASATTICQGSSVTLSVVGGSLGFGAQWQWYRNSCGGVSVGSGSSITISPGQTRTYFVRAEGTCNTTSCAGGTTVTVVPPPTTANAGSPQTICSTGSATLAANTATVGTGAWAVTSGPSTSSSQFSSTSNPAATFTPAGGAGSYVLTWTITNAPCSASASNVTITVNDVPTTANAGPDQLLCSSSATLAANTPTVGTGAWSIISGAGGSVTTTNDPVSGFTGITGTVYTLVWTIDNTPCAASTDTVIIDLTAPVDPADAGVDQTVCSDNATLAGNTPVVGTGTWSVVSGSGSFSNANAGNSGVTGLSVGANVFQWTISNPGCGSTNDQVTVTYDTLPLTTPGPITGPHSICAPATGVTASIAPVAGATSYLWSVGPGTTGVTFTSPVNGLSVTFDLAIVNPGNSGYTIVVKAMKECDTTGTNLFIRRIVSVPVFTLAPIVACPGDSVNYKIKSVGGADYYTWTAPVGSTINGNPTPWQTPTGLDTSVVIVFPAGFNTGNVSVTASVACFTSAPRTVAVKKTPAKPGIISGLFTICPGQTGVSYSITPINGAINYTWTAPPNSTLVSGQGTTTVEIDFSSAYTFGNISVTSSSACATSPVQANLINSSTATGAAVTPNNIIGVVTGLCGFTTSYTCPTQSGVYFNWSLPTGTIINSGQGTNNINVTFAGNFVNDLVCVDAQNGCNVSAPRCIHVRGIPKAPTPIVATPSTFCANQTGLSFSATPPPGNVTYYNWVLPSGATITSGQGTSTITADWGANSGKIFCTARNDCGAATATKTITLTCREGHFEVTNVSEEFNTLQVYPNPASDRLNISYSAAKDDAYQLIITDITGRQLVNEKVNLIEGENAFDYNVSKFESGSYIIFIKNGEKTDYSKFVKE